MKGGFQVRSRLATCLDEIRMEAQVAGASRSRRERDRAFVEIQRIARASAELLQHPQPPKELGNRQWLSRTR
jgi:hypothetical protein